SIDSEVKHPVNAEFKNGINLGEAVSAASFVAFQLIRGECTFEHKRPGFVLQQANPATGHAAGD
ncbi:unnamed protein product, partial [Didymodactylos carnosus]